MRKGGSFRNNALCRRGKTESSNKSAIYGHIRARKEKGNRSRAPYGQGKTWSSSKWPICGHIGAGRRRSIRNNALCGRERQEYQKSPPMWAGQDKEMQQALHIWAYVGEAKGRVSETTPHVVGGGGGGGGGKTELQHVCYIWAYLGGGKGTATVPHAGGSRQSSNQYARRDIRSQCKG